MCSLIPADLTQKGITMETTMQTEIHEFRLDDPQGCEWLLTEMVMAAVAFIGEEIVGPEQAQEIALKMAAIVAYEDNQDGREFIANAVIAHARCVGEVVTPARAHDMARAISHVIVAQYD